MNRPVKWRYLLVGAGFVVLAAVRLAQDETVWAGVFAVAAAVNCGLGLSRRGEARRADAAGAADAVADGAAETGPASGPLPGPAVVERSLAGYRTSARQWHVLGAVGVLLGGGLLLVEPALAILAGAAALFALHRARRAGRAVATLRRASLAHR